MSKLSLLLLFGGESSEHEVSITSATHVNEALSPDRYDVSLCYITPNGRWFLVDKITSNPLLIHQLVPHLGEQSFLILPDNTPLDVDVILPVLHGKHGEDGTVQGLAQLLHIPCVGPSLLSAASTMDKDMTKRLAAAAGVPVVPWMTVHHTDQPPSYMNVRNQLGDTVFVKPSRVGSSVGVSKVTTAEELETALQAALFHDDTALIETAVTAREIELAVLGHGAQAKVSGAGEIIPGEEFYSYADKYSTESASKAIIPAAIDEATLAQLQRYALTAYHATDGTGMARVDFFLLTDGTIYLNEINSIPGFTPISMYPKLWAAAGLPPEALMDQLVSQACESHAIIR